MTPQWHIEKFKQTVLAAERPVLVDFHADWCGPCRSQGPNVDALAAEYAGRVSVGKFADAAPGLDDRRPPSHRPDARAGSPRWHDLRHAVASLAPWPQGRCARACRAA